jgi:hypothetical protein
MTLPGETEAGSAGKQPCRGIAWWAHRDDENGACELHSAPLPDSIGSVDPDALKIPARRAESSLTEHALIPVHAEPGQLAAFSTLLMLICAKDSFAASTRRTNPNKRMVSPRPGSVLLPDRDGDCIARATHLEQNDRDGVPGSHALRHSDIHLIHTLQPRRLTEVQHSGAHTADSNLRWDARRFIQSGAIDF